MRLLKVKLRGIRRFEETDAPLVADRLGLDSIMIEQNPVDAQATTARLLSEAPLFTDVHHG